MPYSSSSLSVLSFLCAGLLVAGCGDDSSADGAGTTGQDSSGTTAPTTTASADTGSSTDGGSTDGSTGPADSGTEDTTGTGDTGADESTGTTGDVLPEPHVAGGSFGGLPGYEGTGATGFALIVRRQDGTDVSVQVSDLMPDTDYPVHVHVQACDDDAGGGHYKIDPSIMDTQADNELWPAFTTDADGVGRVGISTDHLARGDAMSVVVHDPGADNAKMLCADLVTTGDTDPFTTSGEGIVLMAAMDGGYGDMTASATMERSVDAGTAVSLDVTGLDPDEEYMVHVHDRDCASGDGGGHYKLDYGVMGTEETNELWLPVTTDGNGDGTTMVSFEHLARAAAQAVVVHDNDGSGARLTCIDLAE